MIMRVSVYKSDAGYIEDWMNYVVYLNDELCNHCVTADEELGIAIVLKKDEAGNFVIKGDYIDDEIISGKVNIVKKKDSLLINQDIISNTSISNNNYLNP